MNDLLAMAKIAAEAGNLPRARAYLEQARMLDPTSQAVQQAWDRLSPVEVRLEKHAGTAAKKRVQGELDALVSQAQALEGQVDKFNSTSSGALRLAIGIGVAVLFITLVAFVLHADTLEGTLLWGGTGIGVILVTLGFSAISTIRIFALQHSLADIQQKRVQKQKELERLEIDQM